jgi:hypothetical protein
VAFARLAWFHPALIARTPGWSGVESAAPWQPLEAYLAALIVVSSCAGWAALAAAVARFTALQRRAQPTPSLESRLPPYPFDDRREAVVLGELHQQEGAQVETPRWLTLPFEGLYGNLICIGATGSAKTSALAYPLTAQLLRIHADDPQRKLGGLVMDPKGNYAHYVRRQCELAGRADDFYEISLGGDVVCNVLARPDLSAPALAGHFFDAVKNVQGESVHDPFWRQEAIDLCTQAIRVIRIVNGVEPTLQSVYRAATSFESFERWVKQAQEAAAEARVKARKREATPEERRLVEEVESLTFWAEGKLSKLDPKLRASIAAGLNGACSLCPPDPRRLRTCHARPIGREPR